MCCTSTHVEEHGHTLHTWDAIDPSSVMRLQCHSHLSMGFELSANWWTLHHQLMHDNQWKIVSFKSNRATRWARWALSSFAHQCAGCHIICASLSLPLTLIYRHTFTLCSCPYISDISIKQYIHHNVKWYSSRLFTFTEMHSLPFERFSSSTPITAALTSLCLFLFHALKPSVLALKGRGERGRKRQLAKSRELCLMVWAGDGIV